MLPGLTASFAMAPILVRSLRVGMLEVMDAEFIAVARAKGLGDARVLFAHVARNALVPTVTLLGLNIAYLIGSTVIVEQVFNLNGLGSLLLSSILNRDFPVVQATTLVLGRRCRAPQLGHRLAGRPPRPQDPAPMTTLTEPRRRAAGACRRAGGYSPSPYPFLLAYRARHSPTLIVGAAITLGVVLDGGAGPADKPVLAGPPGPLQYPERVSPPGTCSARTSSGGTNYRGLIWAARTDLRVGVLAVIFPFCFGTVVGTLAGTGAVGSTRS